MRFDQLNMLNLFWGLILLIIFLIWSISYRKNNIKKLVEEKLQDEVAFNFKKTFFKRKNFYLILVFIFSILALARPQWGFEWQEIKHKGIDILIAIDCSKSMLTQDVKPNRLERTKLAVKDLIKKLKGDRIGLIAFSGEAFLICPLTVDYSGFLLSLNDINTNTIPRGGTNISKAIKVAMQSYDNIPNKYKQIIIITDGDNLEGDPISTALEAKKKDIKIFTVGIGTEEGELIRVKNENNEYEFLKDNNGNFIKSRLNEDLLEQIALTTGGLYVKASGAEFGLDLIYEKELSKIEKRDIESKMEKKYYERFQIPLAFAILFLLIDTCLNNRKK